MCIRDREALRDQGLRAQLLIDSDELHRVAEQFNRSDLGLLFESVGKGDLKASSVAKRLVANLQDGDSNQRLPAKPAQHRGSRRRRTSGVHVEGFDDSLVRLAGCCNPVPGDEILGFVTKGRGISVHRDDCTNASELVGSSGARHLEVDWDSSFSGQFRTMIEVRALDRDRLLAEVVSVISDHHLSISSAHTFTGDDQVSVLQFDIEVGDPTLLEQLFAAIRDVDGVFDAHRVVPNSVRPPS